MYTTIEKLGIVLFLKKETLPLILAWSIAEVFFKFGSFTLECALFLTTWLVMGKFLSLATKRLNGKN